MSRDGSGNYTRVAGPYVGGTTILKDNINDELDDLGDEITASPNIAGTKAWAADQPMGGFKFTGLGAGSSAGHSVRYEQVFPSVFQPLDATLTALAALSWASGNALIQFTAADTVSLTLTPSVTSLTASGNITTTAGIVSAPDGSAAAPSIKVGDEQNGLFSGGVNQFGIATNGAQRAVFGTSSLTLSVNLALGNGGTISWNSGDVTITHSSNALEVTGGGVAAPLLQVTGVSGTLVAATHRNRQLLVTGDITLDDGVFAAADWHVFTCDGTNRTITRAAGLTMYVNGVDSATATITARTTGGAVWETASVVHLIGSGIA